MAFCNLHGHDHGSLLDGAGTPSQRVNVAKEIGQDSVCITNHGNLVTVPDHIKACVKSEVRPIVGMEAYFKPNRLLQDNEHKKSWHLILLAKNQTGFNNLIKLSSEGFLSGFYYKPCIDYELLEKYSEGLICSSACINGYLSWQILENNDSLVHDTVQKHLNIFGEDYRLEIMPHDVPAQKLVNLAKMQLSMEYGIPLVATSDSHYPYKDWKDTQDIILMISTGQTKNQRKKKRDAGEDVYEMDIPLHMFSEDEMYEMFAHNHPDLGQKVVQTAIDESQNIAESIHPYDIDRSPKLPKISSTPKQARVTLKAWCDEGLKRVGKQDDPEYLQRLDHELKIINTLGVTDYFVLVAKMTRWAREKKIRISSGRGSAAGSLVCYLTKITMIDPIAHDLLFERFMNPNRKGLPDIDLDFDAERIPEVIEWLTKERGEEMVSHIGSFGTYHPKGALKDVARVLDVPFAEINTVTKVIPEAADVGGAGNVPSLAVLRKQNGFLNSFAEKYPEVWKHAIRIEGQIKQLSKHAAGIVVSDKPLTDYVPIVKGKTSNVTSWTAKADSDIISEMQLLKIDILSLDGLTKQGNTVRIIQEQTGEDIDLDNLPVVTDPGAIDEDVMRIFQKGLTLGVFQFGGSRGITNFLKHVKPDRFEDLVAINALYRPGPLEGGDAFKYGDLKQGKAPIEYWHESVIPFLERTYGVLVYQEQLQQIAQALGDFSPADSDDMRKATSKLYRMGKAEARAFMEDYHETWIEGCKNHGLSEEKAEYIWERMIAFGAYSFNRSHASSYALIAYQDAYLKAKYPQPFYASLLTNEADEKAEIIAREAKQLDVHILPPDINESDAEFTVADNKLLYGLRAVKYIGDEAMAELEAKRPFTSYEDFDKRVERKKINKRAKESLVKAGAFDMFGMRKGSTQQLRDQELEALGVSLSGSVDIELYSDIIEQRSNTEHQFDQMAEGEGLTIGGEIISIKTIQIKRGKNKGKTMAFVGIGHKMDQFDCTFFSDQYTKYKKYLQPGEIVFIQGRKSDREQVLVDKLIRAEKLAEAIK